jgi:hypothetical protein
MNARDGIVANAVKAYGIIFVITQTKKIFFAAGENTKKKQLQEAYFLFF